MDFYCAEERLVVELDGAAHDDPARAAADAERQGFLEGLGLQVLRFENRMLFERGEAVLAFIAGHFRGPSGFEPGD